MYRFEYDEEAAIRVQREEGKIEMVKKMLSMKIPIIEIAKISDWSEKKILSLYEEN